MKGDFARVTFDPSRHYSQVFQQQGRVLLEADWNEQAHIQLHLLRGSQMLMWHITLLPLIVGIVVVMHVIMIRRHGVVPPIDAESPVAAVAFEDTAVEEAATVAHVPFEDAAVEEAATVGVAP